MNCFEPHIMFSVISCNSKQASSAKVSIWRNSLQFSLADNDVSGQGHRRSTKGASWTLTVHFNRLLSKSGSLPNVFTPSVSKRINWHVQVTALRTPVTNCAILCRHPFQNGLSKTNIPFEFEYFISYPLLKRKLITSLRSCVFGWITSN